MLDGNAIHKNQLDNTPKTQILTYSEDDDQEPEERTYWCAICKSRLEYLKDSDTIWRCYNCMEYHDTKIQDKPIKDNKDFRVAPRYDLQFYPTPHDENYSPFFQAIHPDPIGEEDSDLEIVRTSADSAAH
jgi:hypothetical protein